MAAIFLRSFSDEDIIASSGLTREVFIEVYNKYCGYDTPINRSVTINVLKDEASALDRFLSLTSSLVICFVF